MLSLQKLNIWLCLRVWLQSNKNFWLVLNVYLFHMVAYIQFSHYSWIKISYRFVCNNSVESTLNTIFIFKCTHSWQNRVRIEGGTGKAVYTFQIIMVVLNQLTFTLQYVSGLLQSSGLQSMNYVPENICYSHLTIIHSGSPFSYKGHAYYRCNNGVNIKIKQAIIEREGRSSLGLWFYWGF